MFKWQKKILFYAVGVLFFTTIVLHYNNCSEYNLMDGRVTSPSVTPTITPQQGPDPRADTVSYSNLNNPISSTPDYMTADGFLCWGSIATVNPVPPIPSITYKGIAYPLTIISGGSAAGTEDCRTLNLLESMLDPLIIDRSYNIRFLSAQGIYSFRFKTPAEASRITAYFMINAGIGASGPKQSFSKSPGEFYDDGRAKSFSYCDIGGIWARGFGYVSDQPNGSTDCPLLQNSYYYFNVLIDRDESNPSSFGIHAFIPKP